MKSIKKPLFSICLLLLLLSGIIGVSQLLYKRFDLTVDKRYTLSPTTQQLLAQIKGPIDIKVLLKGNIPAEYKRRYNYWKNIRQPIKISILILSISWKEKMWIASYKLLVQKVLPLL